MRYFNTHIPNAHRHTDTDTHRKTGRQVTGASYK